MSESNDKTIVVSNSPIEFILSGPSGKHDLVLVRSDESQLDLIGYAVEFGEDAKKNEDDRSYDHSLARLISFGAGRNMHSVDAVAVSDIEQSENRKTIYRYSWVGEGTKSDEKKIKELFEKHIKDIVDAIRESDKELVEWSLGPIILKCTKAKKRRRRLFSLLFNFAAIITIYAMAGVIYWLIRYH